MTSRGSLERIIIALPSVKGVSGCTFNETENVDREHLPLVHVLEHSRLASIAFLVSCLHCLSLLPLLKNGVQEPWLQTQLNTTIGDKSHRSGDKILECIEVRQQQEEAEPGLQPENQRERQRFMEEWK